MTFCGNKMNMGKEFIILHGEFKQALDKVKHEIKDDKKRNLTIVSNYSLQYTCKYIKYNIRTLKLQHKKPKNNKSNNTHSSTMKPRLLFLNI